MVLHAATHEPTSNASLSLTMLRLSGVKFSMSATNNQTGMLALQKLHTGGKQTVVVQHVQVSQGGQAVIAGELQSIRRDGEGG